MGNHNALYRTVTFLVTLSDLWRSFRWSAYCYHSEWGLYARSVSDN